MSGTLYALKGGLWHPHNLAKGPFAGQHGGAIAGILAGTMEMRARSLDAGLASQMTCYLMSAAALEPVEIEVQEVSHEERITRLRAIMMQNDRQIAEATAIFIKPLTFSALPQFPGSVQKQNTEYYDVGDFSDMPWFRDAIDIERDKQGWFWLRHKMPISLPMGPLSLVTSLVDLTSALARPEWFGTNNVVSFPNADLTVHLVRAPKGEWVGIDGRSQWLSHGAGLTFANLYDEQGFIGRSSQSVVLVAND